MYKEEFLEVLEQLQNMTIIPDYVDMCSDTYAVACLDNMRVILACNISKIKAEIEESEARLAAFDAERKRLQDQKEAHDEK